MLEDLKKLKANLRKLGNSSINIVAVGTYPNNQRTPVQDVAKYQNDGTATITPSQFVERAESAAGGWSAELGRAIEKYIDGDMRALDWLGDKIAKDIGTMCDRIDTGRLKASFRAVVKNGS